jgi:hypothetical protein
MRRARALGLSILASLAVAAGPFLVASAGSTTVRSSSAVSPPSIGGWSAPVSLFSDKQGASVASVSCASANACLAVGTKGGSFGTGIALSGPTSWSSSQGSSGGFNAVSCIPGGFCLAVGKSDGEDGATYSLSAGKWSTGPDSPVALASVSCASTTFCVGVGFLNYASAYVFNGTSWSAQIPISVQGSSISCPTIKFCAVVSSSGDVAYYQNGKWSQAVSIDPNRGFSSISCTDATFCVAVDSSGNALTDINGRWSRPDYAKPLDPNSSLTGVSCPTTQFCVAVDLAGAAYFFDGSLWSSAQTISSSVALTSVSCPTTAFCVAGGESPFVSPKSTYAVTWTPPASSFPAAPTDLSANPGDGEVALSWSKPPANGPEIKSYVCLWRTGTSSTSSSKPVAADATTCDVTGLTNRTSYQFAVYASSAAGSGQPTSWLSSTPSANSPPLAPGDFQAALKPASTFAISSPEEEVDLSWTKPPAGSCSEQVHAMCTLTGYTLDYDDSIIKTIHGITTSTFEPVTKSISANATSVDIDMSMNLESDTFDLIAKSGDGSSPEAQATSHDTSRIGTRPAGGYGTARRRTGESQLDLRHDV